MQYIGKPYHAHNLPASPSHIHLNNIGAFKSFTSVPPISTPVRVLVSQVVFFPPTHPPPPSLPASPAENDSVYFYPLVLSSLRPFHPFSLTFKPLLLSCFQFSFLLFLALLHFVIMNITLLHLHLCLEEVHLHDGQMENVTGFERVFYGGKLHHLLLSC